MAGLVPVMRTFFAICVTIPHLAVQSLSIWVDAQQQCIGCSRCFGTAWAARLTQTKEIAMPKLRYLNTVLTVIAILLSLNLWTLWTSSTAVDIATPVHAQGLSNAGAQRAAMVSAMKENTKKMDQLIALMKSGQVRVRVEAGK
jgi:hypothetical protein